MRIGFDIGGTFTDLVLIEEDSGRVTVGKTLTTTHEPAEAVARGVAELLQTTGTAPTAIEHPVHGATTLITNTIIERSGAETALLTTRGFRDVIEIGREWRYDIYDLFQPRSEPLAPRRLRFEVTERVGADGSVELALDEDELERCGEALVAAGAEAVAICFLNAFANPAHEQRAAELLAERHPDLPIIVSSEVAPEIREYERTSTAIACAYVAPKVSKHFHRLEQAVHGEGVEPDVYLMHSSGGIVSLETAARFPIKLIESGPAAGALGAAFIGEQIGETDLISFDMGGTTAKICCIDRAEPAIVNDFEAARLKRFRRGSGIPLLVPVIDVTEIGAGGGSIAHVDGLGLLKVGPQSAGASPGPVCYGQGGTLPTVTDANLVLGYLNPDYFLGGKMSLELEATRAALQEHVGAPLSIDAVQAAAGVVRVVDENMANAAKIHLAERGKDPRRYSLIAFGGAGALHGRELTRALGMRRYVCPLGSGALSALGLLAAPVAMDFQQTAITPLDALAVDHVEALLADMEQRARDSIAATGADLEAATVTRSVEARYIGQGYSVTVTLPAGDVGAEGWAAEVRRRFEEVYGKLYGSLNPTVGVELTTWRILVSAPGSTPTVSAQVADGRTLAQAVKAQRQIYSLDLGSFVAATVYDHYALPPGATFEGPAVVEQRESTCVVGVGDRVTVDEYQSLRIEVAA